MPQERDAHHALVEREAQLRAILDTEPECVALLAADGALLEINPAGLRMIEAESLDQVKNQCVMPLVVEEHRTAFRELTERVMRGESGTLEFQIIGLRGGRRWLETHAAPLRDVTGEVTALLGIMRDITERKRAETALRESEERFRLLVDHAPEAIVLLDVQTGRFIHSNPAAERLFKLPSVELARRGPVELSPATQPDGEPSSAKARALIAAALAGETPVFEWTHRDATGREFPCEVRLLRMDFGGRAIVRGSVLDITERKVAEARIRQLTRTFAVLSDINQTIVREKDPQALLVAACRIAVEQGGFKLAWIGLAESDGRLRVVAHAGADLETSRVLRGYVEGEQPECIFTFSALQFGEPSVCLDIAGDERTAAWREAALVRDYRAMASLPLKVGGRIAGTFNLYADTAGFFDTEELKLLDELAGDIGFALEAQEQERERRRTERALQDLVRTVDGIVWEADPDTFQFTFVSPHAERLLGYPTERWLTEPDFWTDHLHPEDRERAIHYCVTCTRAGQDHQFEYRMLAANGRTVWLRDLVTVVIEKGHPVKLRGIMVDITAAKQAEAALRESEERFRQIAETIEDVFSIADPTNNHVLYVSPAYERIWGRSVQSLYTSPREWFEAIHPQDRARVLEAATIRQATGKYDLEYRIVRPDGQERWIRDVAYPIRDESDRVSRIVGVARDITEQRLLEEQLRQAQKMEALGLLAGGVAHDFNNLLGAILGNAELARQDLDDAHPALESVREIVAAGHRGKDLAQRLLTFSRPQSAVLRPIALQSVVEEAVRLLRSTLPAGVQITLRCIARSTTILADASQLHQVIINLATNAWQAMEEERVGRIDFELDTCDVDDRLAALHPGLTPGPHVLLSVTDTGRGMDAATRERIFEPFFTTKPPGRGTGLGLSVVHGIVRTHGGAISVEGEPGRGATFRLYFPMCAASAVRAAEDSGSAHRERGRGEHILYLDDDEPLVYLAVRFLERLGYRVTGHTRADDALTAFRANPGDFDLVITDLSMSGMSGFNVATELMRIRADVPVVLCTGYLRPGDAEKARTLGIREIILKPNTVEEFGAVIRRILAPRSQAETQ
jgi:PAS domain S-box-containing protein